MLRNHLAEIMNDLIINVRMLAAAGQMDSFSAVPGQYLSVLMDYETQSHA
jgi:hypothetical protein